MSVPRLGLACLLGAAPVSSAGPAADTAFYDDFWNPTARQAATCYFVPPAPGERDTVGSSPLADTLDGRPVKRIHLGHPYLPDSLMIGRKVAIKDLRFHYPELGGGKLQETWPSSKVRKETAKADIWKPEETIGDTGRIAWVFPEFRTPPPQRSRVYIVKTPRGHAVLGGQSLTMPGFLPVPDNTPKRDPRHPEGLALVPEALLRGGIAGGASLQYAKLRLDSTVMGVSGPRIGIEAGREGLDGLKIGYDYGQFLATGASLCVYLGEPGELDFRLLPEFGLQLGRVRIVYGYALHLAGTELSRIGSHRLSLGGIIPLWMR